MIPDYLVSRKDRKLRLFIPDSLEKQFYGRSLDQRTTFMISVGFVIGKSIHTERTHEGVIFEQKLSNGLDRILEEIE